MEATITPPQTRRSWIEPDRLREAREGAALTQTELAHLIDCSTRSLNSWENGKRMPHARYVRRLSDQLDVSVAWLRGLND